MARTKKSKISNKIIASVDNSKLETIKKNQNVEELTDFSKVLFEKMLNSLEKISSKQESFEKQTIDIINKQSLAISEIQKEFSHINTPVQSGQDEFIESTEVDKDGIVWGNTKKDEFKQSSAKTGNKILDSLGIPPEAIAGIASKIIDSLLSKPQAGNMGNIFQELMIRDFMENHQYSKMIQKAQMQSLFKKDLINSYYLAKMTKNSDILNDPLNGVIDNMRKPKT